MVRPAVREPAHTIYVERWRLGLSLLPCAPLAPQLTPLVHEVEAAWAYVRPLQVLYEANRPEAGRDDVVGRFLTFIDADVVDFFRSVAFEILNGVLQPDTFSVDALDGEATAFDRTLTLLHLAASDPAIPAPIRVGVHRSTVHLLGWYATVQPLIAALPEDSGDDATPAPIATSGERGAA